MLWIEPQDSQWVFIAVPTLGFFPLSDGAAGMFSPWNLGQQAEKGLGSPPPILCVVSLFSLETGDLHCSLHEDLGRAIPFLEVSYW